MILLLESVVSVTPNRLGEKESTTYAKPLPEEPVDAVGALTIDPFHDMKREAQECVTARPVYDMERVPVTV